MKIWKALGIAALAAVVPVRWKKDEETGKRTFQSLLWKLDITPKGVDTREIGLDLMEGVVTGPILNAVAAKKEAALFADDDPEAARIEQDETTLSDLEISEAKLDEMIAEAEAEGAALDALTAEAETNESAPDTAQTIETEA